jgi:hypothetical protein
MILGLLSQTKGQRGLEVGFAAMGAVFAVAALLLCVSAIFTFKKDRILDN